jgi:hypothetical protein
MEEHTEDAKVEEEAARIPVNINLHFYSLHSHPFTQIKIAIWASLVANLSLCALQCTSAPLH